MKCIYLSVSHYSSRVLLTLRILLNKLLEAKLKCMEEIKCKFRMQFFFYVSLQSSSKPYAPQEFRNGFKVGDLKTGDMVWISFSPSALYINCTISRNNPK